MRRGRVEGGPRKSAKGVIEDFADELLKRKNDPNVKHKLLTIEAIALRMNWKPLYDRLHFTSSMETYTIAKEFIGEAKDSEVESVPPADPKKPWYAND